MLKMNKAPSLRKMHFIVGIFLVISIFVFVAIGFSVQYQDLQETYHMAEKTTSFLKAECQKYDNYIRGNSARTLKGLLECAESLDQFISKEDQTNDEFLDEFIRTENIGGVLILDQNFSLIAQADMMHKETYDSWYDVITNTTIKDMFQNPKKTYIDHLTVDHAPYDMAALVSKDGERLILCYLFAESPASDPYELTLKSILENNNFYKNPYLAITDGTRILSTNSSVIEKISPDQYKKLSSSIEWKENQFAKFEYQNTTYYGLRYIYNNYYVYSVYAAEDVFANRKSFIVFVLEIYMAVGIIILAFQKHSDKISINKMEKQLDIINAISTSYTSIFLLHMDRLELEAVNPSNYLNAVFEKHSNAYEFLTEVCEEKIAKKYHASVRNFLDLNTLADRLKGQVFLGNEFQDNQGIWYSVSLIPQKYDSNGNLQTLLIATRDISSAKETEELSFKDRLTGLYNRNYMEVRSKEGVRVGDFPVSLIMVDCNYLKRTNDTLGHEYGDLLLQRIANAIVDTIPKNCIVMRVGGDKFLILCMQCNNQQAKKIISDIKEKLVEQSDDKLILSAAFGAATVEDGAFCFEEVYKKADQEMYRDKKANRIKRE